MSVPTYGLTHVALAVRDVQRSAKFYRSVLGAKVVYRDDAFIQLQTPGARDVLVLERDKKRAGKSGGQLHFGFRLQDARDIGAARRAVLKAGGSIFSEGEFVPGEPYVFFYDLDGYEVQIWYEKPTRVDPKPTTRRKVARK